MTLARLIEEVMEAQLAGSRFNHRELRLSENLSCPRKRVLRCLGAEVTHPLGLAAARNFEKGRAGELWVERLLEKQFPGEIRREVVVRHPYGEPHGEGHIDIEWPARQLLVEIKTTSEQKAASGLPVPAHVVQVMSYLHFYRAGGKRLYDRAEILYLVLQRHGIVPVSFPVTYDPASGESIEAQMADLWRNFVLQGKVPFLPEGAAPKVFPCYWEAHDNGAPVPHYCEYWGHCWQGEEADADAALERVSSDKVDLPGEIELFQGYASLRREHSLVEAEAKRLKEARSILEERLSSLFDQYGAKRLSSGGISISRTVVPGRPYWDVASAIACGAVDPAVLEPFKKESSSYSRYKVESS